MSALSDPLLVGRATSRNRIVFGPHETNLGRGRAISERHVAYYAARAAGGAGIVVTEEASVDPSDWPYERAPLASECGAGWRAVADRCHPEGALVFAALGHSGGQGTSAYHQQALLAPSAVPDVSTREVPKAMEDEDIATVVAGFAASAALAVGSGCDGVEVNSGQWSLLRQFLSPLTNRRGDRYGQDRTLLLGEVLATVRAAVGTAAVGLRLSADELAPWAGLVPEAAAEALRRLGDEGLVDYVTVVRGSAYGTQATRPDAHEAEGFNLPAAALIRAALPAPILVVAQGSIVDASLARRTVDDGLADAVEVTRAQIADARFGLKTVAGDDDLVRPCVLCNQQCQVRDVRNPIVSCIGEPLSGHEAEGRDGEPSPNVPGRTRARVLIVGAGPAGLECARVLASASVSVLLVEKSERVGGMVVRAAARLPGRVPLARLTAWLESECRRLGVEIRTGEAASAGDVGDHDGPVVVATGSRTGRRSYEISLPERVIDIADFWTSRPSGASSARVVVWDPLGGPEGVGAAELLARGGAAHVELVTPDFVAGERLARSGDLAPAGVRLARLGVRVSARTLVRLVDSDGVRLEDRFSGETRLVEGGLVVDCGHRLPDDSLFEGHDRGRAERAFLVGDAVAPRTIHEAVLEGRRAALAIVEGAPGAGDSEPLLLSS